MDDKVNGLGMRLASGLAASSSLYLWICATWGPLDGPAILTGLILFGASSGGIEPLISAHIQRQQLMGNYPGLRLFGTGGWLLGLTAASLGFLAGSLESVYLLAGIFLGYLVVISPAAHPTAQVQRPSRPRLPRPALIFILVGLPVPISAYVYLVFSAAAFESIRADAGNPFLTLFILAVLEVPAFLLVRKIIPGRRLLSLYALTMVFLALSWVALMAANGRMALQLAALVAHALAAAMWASLQVNVVRHYAQPGHVAFSQASASAMAKGLSAAIAGIGAGWVLATFGATAAAWFILTLCFLSLVSLIILAKSPSSPSSTKIPHNEELSIER
ncbi:hypothetical protein ACMX2H_01280 [Arthrobacter sulfonylureivorans]|uniref:hypothetical protein n=1 Tax=Arthrobacter sulfonylureivorans TaxID=2486855 RepID=UPI0039E2261A